ncbi:MAG: hypothetical protein L6U99_06800 [Clostridium sp.]|nr:MAG: hypothetical protein L6U99_06800 [Clostridium sp.]
MNSVTLYADGEKYDEESVIIGKEFSFGIAKKVGYTFLGWYSAEVGGTVYTDSEGSSNGMLWKKEYPLVAYAHFEANTYKIVFLIIKMLLPKNTIKDVSVIYDQKN